MSRHAISRRLAAVIFLLVAGLWPGRAEAQTCFFFGLNTIDFGNVDLGAGTPFTTTGQLQALCFGTTGRTIRICPNFGDGSGGSSAGAPRFMLNGANQLAYNLYSDAAHTQVWGSYLWANPQTPPTLDLPGGFIRFGARTVYGQIPAGQSSLPAGLYTSTFNGLNATISYAYSSVGNCAAISGGAGRNATITFNVRAQNIAACFVTATNVDFGVAGLLAANVDATGTVSVTCNGGTSYAVGLDGGLSGAVDPTQRKMTLGAGQVTYGLYRDAARSLGWGSTIGTDTISGTGNGAAMNYTVYGRVAPQTTPPPGTYTDTIVVTVTY